MLWSPLLHGFGWCLKKSKLSLFGGGAHIYLERSGMSKYPETENQMNHFALHLSCEICNGMKAKKVWLLFFIYPV